MSQESLLYLQKLLLLNEWVFHFEYVKSFFDELNKILPFLPQGFVTSAEKGTGVDEVLACIDQYNKLDAEGL